MRDKANVNVAEEKPLPTLPSPPVVRAMANTLCDRDINVLTERDPVKIITVLINAGWSSKDIHNNIEPAVMMACIRQRNDAVHNAWLKQLKADIG